MDTTVEFEVLTEDELVEVVGGFDAYAAIGMCGCGKPGGLHDSV